MSDKCWTSASWKKPWNSPFQFPSSWLLQHWAQQMTCCTQSQASMDYVPGNLRVQWTALRREKAYEKLLIILIMTSISLWEVRNHLVLFVLIIQLVTILLLIKTLYNTVFDTAGNIHLAMHFYMNLLQKSLIMSIIWYYWPYHYEKLNGKVSTLSVWFSIQICDLLLIMFHLS